MSITYGDIFNKFKDMFPQYLKGMNDYRPLEGQDFSIHIWMNDGRELVFTYKNKKDWLFETYDHFMMRVNHI